MNGIPVRENARSIITEKRGKVRAYRDREDTKIIVILCAAVDVVFSPCSIF